MSFGSSFTTCPFKSVTVLHTIFRMSAYFKKTFNAMLWLTEQSTCPLYLFCLLRFMLSTIHELSNRDDPQPRSQKRRSPSPKMKTFVVPSRKCSFPMPITLLIRGNTATRAAIHWWQAHSIMDQNANWYVNAYPWQRGYVSRHPKRRLKRLLQYVDRDTWKEVSFQKQPTVTKPWNCWQPYQTRW